MPLPYVLQYNKTPHSTRLGVFCGFPLVAWASWGNADRATTEIGLVELSDSCIALGFSAELDETETALAAGHFVHRKEYGKDRTCGGKVCLYIIFGSGIRETADVDACVLWHKRYSYFSGG